FIAARCEICQSQSNSPPASEIKDSIISIDHLPAPVISLSAIADTLCATPDNLGSYQWYHCGETKTLGISSCLVIESSGCYCVRGKNGLGRTAEICTEFFINGEVPLFRDAITVTPNPTFGNFHVILRHDYYLPVKWILLDFTGKELTSGWLIEKSSDLDFSNYSAGIYLLKLNSREKDEDMKRIVIED
ncbi:MAG TPA: T9SS type A sorting domain-containing protein, partial [Saprospiraceae bacterium]|nr:T9SS type A sorting domain-containing protein [Saprospiraceae bacterium]